MNAQVDVYFDGSCPLCRAEIGALKAADPHDRLQLHDCSPADFLDPHAQAAGIDRAAMMTAMHIRAADGRWLTGVDAFEHMYRAVGIESMARFWGHPWLKPGLVRLYPWIARNRQLLSRLGITRLFEALIRREAVRAAQRRCVDTNCHIEP
jgi:predicted DCC family thiol-disulfide oxidoreductase YuxK